MRLSILPLSLALAFAASNSNLRAENAALLAERASARHELQLAKMEFRHYWRVEYPRELRHLNAAIELTEAEISAYKERLRDYYPFTRFTTGDPFLVTIQELRICLREAELRLRDLWAERNALVRFRSENWRLLELKVHEARLRVAEIEAQLEADDESIPARSTDGRAI